MIKRKGWRSTEQALVGSDLEQVSEKLRRQSFSVEWVPVGTWRGEPVAFVIYKPKPGVSTQKAKKILKPKTQRAAPPVDFDELKSRFAKLFESGIDDVEPSGWYMDQDHNILLISKDFPGTSKKGDVQSWLKKFPSKNGVITEYPPRGFFHALRRSKKKVMRFGDKDSLYDIGLVAKALKILKGAPVTIYSKPTGQHGPLIFKTDSGHLLILAPTPTHLHLTHESVSYTEAFNNFKRHGKV